MVSDEAQQHHTNDTASLDAAAAISNKDFLLATWTAIVALLLSATILISGYVLFSPVLNEYTSVQSSNDVRIKTIPGKDLISRLGATREGADGSTTVHRLHDGQDKRAILTRKIRASASDYPFISYTFKNRHPGEYIYLLWRTAAEPDKVETTRLYWNGESTSYFHIAKEQSWQGKITEIGFDIYGDLRGTPLTISHLSLLPASPNAFLRTIGSEWTAFRGWTQKSINNLKGTPDNAILSPTLASAAWSGLTLIVLLFISRKANHAKVISCAAAIMIPWISIDMLWQNELSTQLAETRYLFEGKSQHEKHLADEDAEIYQYAQHLKSEVLPEPGFRLFILDDSEAANYQKLKLHYHLLPHNIFSFHMGYEPQLKMRPGDHVIILGDLKALKSVSGKEVLDWGDMRQQPITRIDSRSERRTYLVEESMVP